MNYTTTLPQINRIITSYRAFVDIKAKEAQLAKERAEPSRKAFIESIADLIDAGGKKNDIAKAIGNTNWEHVTGLWNEGRKVLDKRHGLG